MGLTFTYSAVEPSVMVRLYKRCVNISPVGRDGSLLHVLNLIIL